jgi:hypothetical protein
MLCVCAHVLALAVTAFLRDAAAGAPKRKNLKSAFCQWHIHHCSATECSPEQFSHTKRVVCQCCRNRETTRADNDAAGNAHAAFALHTEQFRCHRRLRRHKQCERSCTVSNSPSLTPKHWCRRSCARLTPARCYAGRIRKRWSRHRMWRSEKELIKWSRLSTLHKQLWRSQYVTRRPPVTRNRTLSARRKKTARLRNARARVHWQRKCVPCNYLFTLQQQRLPFINQQSLNSTQALLGLKVELTWVG